MLQSRRFISVPTLIVLLVSGLTACRPGMATEPTASNVPTTLNVLFIGNSYTARHNLPEIVKAMAEEGNPNLTFQPTQVIYGGRTLKDHWQFGTQHIVNRHSVTRDEVAAQIAELKKLIQQDQQNKYAASALKQMNSLLAQIENKTLDRGKWDVIVLQSYRDDVDGTDSLYMQYAPKFADLAKSQDARVLLYETTPATQNQYPIAQNPDSTPVIEKAKTIAALADRIDAKVAPMSYVAMKCQQGNPEITLRFVNDAHLNQTMAYLTACTMYAALFDRTPEGLSLDSVTDIRFLNNDRKTHQDRDGNPIKKHFPDQERAFLQSTAWTALEEFESKFRSGPSS